MGNLKYKRIWDDTGESDMKRAIRLWLKVVTAIPLTSLLIQTPVNAQDPGGCFMVTSSGETISLGKLCGATSNPTPQKTGVVRIPILRRSGGTPVIGVTFNGSKTFEMILDTGASRTLITQAMAEDLNLKANGIMRASVADGREIQLQTGRIQSIDVGGAVTNNIEAAIAPKAEIGLLGQDIFQQYDVRILKNFVEFHRRSNSI
ncbi:MAG: retropepsin-like aspartic protease [Cyanobacteria bacterium P01_A01_bin.45]